MPLITGDGYGHPDTPPLENTMAAGALGTTAAGTVAPTANAGTTATVTGVTASDNCGTFNLNSAGTGQAAGAQVVVTFAQSFRKPPKKVFVDVVDITTATAPVLIAAYSTSVTSAGFQITTPALTAAHTYLVIYDTNL